MNKEISIFFLILLLTVGYFSYSNGKKHGFETGWQQAHLSAGEKLTRCELAIKQSNEKQRADDIQSERYASIEEELKATKTVLGLDKPASPETICEAFSTICEDEIQEYADDYAYEYCEDQRSNEEAPPREY